MMVDFHSFFMTGVTAAGVSTIPIAVCVICHSKFCSTFVLQIKQEERDSDASKHR